MSSDAYKSGIDPRDAAWARNRASTTPNVTENLELDKWLEVIGDHAARKRLGVYFDVLSMPDSILEHVTAKLRERRFFVSSPIVGTVRYSAAGSAFAIKLVYVNWNREDGQG